MRQSSGVKARVLSQGKNRFRRLSSPRLAPSCAIPPELAEKVRDGFARRRGGGDFARSHLGGQLGEAVALQPGDPIGAGIAVLQAYVVSLILDLLRSPVAAMFAERQGERKPVADLRPQFRRMAQDG